MFCYNLSIEGSLPTPSMLLRLMCLCLVFLFCFSKADITVRAVDRDLPSEQDRYDGCTWQCWPDSADLTVWAGPCCVSWGGSRGAPRPVWARAAPPPARPPAATSCPGPPPSPARLWPPPPAPRDDGNNFNVSFFTFYLINVTVGVCYPVMLLFELVFYICNK